MARGRGDKQENNPPESQIYKHTLSQRGSKAYQINAGREPPISEDSVYIYIYTTCTCVHKDRFTNLQYVCRIFSIFLLDILVLDLNPHLPFTVYQLLDWTKDPKNLLGSKRLLSAPSPLGPETGSTFDPSSFGNTWKTLQNLDGSMELISQSITYFHSLYQSLSYISPLPWIDSVTMCDLGWQGHDPCWEETLTANFARLKGGLEHVWTYPATRTDLIHSLWCSTLNNPQYLIGHD